MDILCNKAKNLKHILNELPDNHHYIFHAFAGSEITKSVIPIIRTFQKFSNSTIILGATRTYEIEVLTSL